MFRSLTTMGINAARFAVSATKIHTKATLPALDYAYEALEPILSSHLLHLHHDKHHQTYVNNLNAAEEKLKDPSLDLHTQIALQSAIKFNGGGHVNHSIYWKNLAPKSAGGGAFNAQAPLGQAIVKKWGSFEAFKKNFNTQLAAIQGSGWGWLIKDADGSLRITTTMNQDTILDATPVITIDAWEHAYYPQYENRKAEYYENIWQIINWKEAEARYEA
ncbi:manganese superoxide dismutase [Schizosaccharomyces japonicus yFS275]|uniref:Superoxide dismutase n=1 Tax=Schizosaccharomyces japonicus (strain yFS275 / FY16936) TaxID=402676 RepID=B6K3W1_SCHJY|nr:manganese superoxide dismutase [Schizosaccharomyces japonicus yFS275]EEB08168.2 manganese superoxide dismutase [Schizosaccharomyces japonicus yFS275]